MRGIVRRPRAALRGHFWRASPAASKWARTRSLVRQLVVGPDPQHRDDALTEALVGRRDHDRLGHLRHGQQRLFDLDGADVLAAADDDVGLAVGDGQVAVVVQHADVAGVVPAVVVEGLRRQLGIEIAEAQIRSPAEDFAVGGEPDLDARTRVAVGEQSLVRRAPSGLEPVMDGCSVLP